MQEHQTVFVRSGEHRWQGEIPVKANRTLHVTAELGARLLLSLPPWVGVRVQGFGSSRETDTATRNSQRETSSCREREHESLEWHFRTLTAESDIPT